MNPRPPTDSLGDRLRLAATPLLDPRLDALFPDRAARERLDALGFALDDARRKNLDAAATWVALGKVSETALAILRLAMGRP